ncbi:ammecr1 family protein [Paracoccidioides lutzii Pb01]|uniref:Ammecr1 family protein n=1 Tax=Paracoccidioides lutzii (strain ATCC MYA-826 / Pb01) TaxID=502779 RepID=C1H9G0_PARBA|nr:ammecr1 family protein [Paracoccidioides lutzii Pb01]EEH36983.1 ammecr1 family protein [Paracoccidioides lutzii Pb01]
MASPAHCFYCFECLYSSFKGTDPPSLAVVKELWEAFESSKELLASADYEDSTDYFENDQNKGIRPSAAVNGGRSEAPDDTSEESDDGIMTGLAPQKAQLRSISRLQGNSSSHSPHSSNLSTPSALSNSSSRSVLTSASSMTSISERASSSFSRTKGVAPGLQTDNADIAYPLFVTWNTLSSSGHKSLRGCIGTFEPQELEAGLKSYALTSAFGDTRFTPIPASLLPSLSCSLTLLSSFETCSDTLDWTLGKHGIRISFTHRGRRLGATYLPDVAVEQGWTKEETMESLMRKAGWEGYSSSSGGKASRAFLRGGLSSASKANNAVQKPWEEVSEFKTVRYQGLKASASYVEWQKWRKWVGSSSDRRELLESGM